MSRLGFSVALCPEEVGGSAKDSLLSALLEEEHMASRGPCSVLCGTESGGTHAEPDTGAIVTASRDASQTN